MANQLTLTQVDELFMQKKLQGIHDVSDEAYFEGPGLSRSDLQNIARSPAHFDWLKKNPKASTPAMAFGSAFHSYILEPENFSKDYVTKPQIDRRTKAGKADWANFLAEHGHKTIISIEDFVTIQGMAKSLSQHPVAKEMLTGGMAEKAAYTTIDNALCKVKADYIKGNRVIDLKTTTDASFEAFQKGAFNFGYHFQAAYYLRVLSAHMEVNKFNLIAIEKEPPYALSVFEYNDAALEKAWEAWVSPAFEKYKQCLELDEWPSYPTEIQSLDLPAWAW